MYVILPFEKEFYKEYGMEVMYIGHPLAVEIKRESNFHTPQSKEILLCCPVAGNMKWIVFLPEMAELARADATISFYNCCCATSASGFI